MLHTQEAKKEPPAKKENQNQEQKNPDQKNQNQNPEQNQKKENPEQNQEQNPEQNPEQNQEQNQKNPDQKEPIKIEYKTPQQSYSNKYAGLVQFLPRARSTRSIPRYRNPYYIKQKRV